jgi:EAL domain-containing protein (putative c-di-GMP-specific phosphodiesterase class I)
MLRLTVQTAHAFGYRVIAPGLDDAEALQAATATGCAYGQGLAATDLLQDHEIEPARVP